MIRLHTQQADQLIRKKSSGQMAIPPDRYTKRLTHQSMRQCGLHPVSGPARLGGYLRKRLSHLLLTREL
jgi:hypothetical protein